MSRHPSTRKISSKSMHAFLTNLANRQTPVIVFTSSVWGKYRKVSRLTKKLTPVTDITWNRTSAHFYFSRFTCGPQLIILKNASLTYVVELVVVVRRDLGRVCMMKKSVTGTETIVQRSVKYMYMEVYKSGPCQRTQYICWRFYW